MDESFGKAGTDVHVRNEATGDVRPVEAPVPAPAAGPCASCGASVPAGKEACPRCGWHAGRRWRQCVRCGGLVVLRVGRSRTAHTAALAAATATAAAAGFVSWRLLGLYGAGAALAVLAALIALPPFLFFFLTTWVCERCGARPIASILRPDERRRFRVQRIASALFGLGLLAVAVVFALPYRSPPAFVHPTDAGAFVVELPRTHRDVERETFALGTRVGVFDATSYGARNDASDVGLFGMLHMVAASGAIGSATDEEVLLATLRGGVRNVGCTLGDWFDVAWVGHPGLEATFSGNFRDLPVNGRARAIRFGDEVIVLLFAGNDPGAANDPGGHDFLQSLRFEPAVRAAR